jgi:hypothetical protein
MEKPWVFPRKRSTNGGCSMVFPSAARTPCIGSKISRNNSRKPALCDDRPGGVMNRSWSNLPIDIGHEYLSNIDICLELGELRIFQ